MEEKFDLIRLTIKLNKDFRDQLLEHTARFRGNIGSISLISLEKNKPLLGRKLNLKELKELNTDNINSFLASNKPLLKPGRVTPEKELEAFILLHNNRKGYTPFDSNIVILTDEFAISNGSRKVVLDLVGFDNATNTIVLIELKSSRSATELIRQLNKAEVIVKENLNWYQCYLKEHNIIWHEPFLIKKIAIWPSAMNSTKGNNFKLNSIIVYGYKSQEEYFTFEKEE